MNPQTKKIIMFLLIVSAMVAMVTLIVIIKKKTMTKPSGEQTSTATPKSPAPQVHIVPRLTKGTGKGNTPRSLELAVKTDKPVGLTAFTLKLSLTAGKEKLLIGTLTQSKTASSRGWTFPVLTAKTDASGVSVLYISGVFIAADPYQLTQELPIVTVPIGPGTLQSITASVDPKETKFVTSGTESLGGVLEYERVTVE